jgi:hypothetical protein
METVTAKQIHEEFDTVADNLANAANVFIVNYDGKLKVIHDERDKTARDIRARVDEGAPAIPFSEKANRLKLLGFTGTKEVTELMQREKQEQDRRSRLWELGHEMAKIHDNEIAALKKAKEEFDQILYYRNKYPFLKFITDDQLNGICRKYNLVYSQVSNYIGEVPDKNLKEIEDARIDKWDFVEETYIVRMKDDQMIKTRVIGRGRYLAENRGVYPFSGLAEESGFKYPYSYTDKRCTEDDSKKGLFIAADKSLFKLKGLEKSKSGFGFFNKLKTKEVVYINPDPIVFRYVKGGVLVISKWGEEANDPTLTVPELN